MWSEGCAAVLEAIYGVAGHFEELHSITSFLRFSICVLSFTDPSSVGDKFYVLGLSLVTACLLATSSFPSFSPSSPASIDVSSLHHRLRCCVHPSPLSRIVIVMA